MALPQPHALRARRRQALSSRYHARQARRGVLPRQRFPLHPGRGRRHVGVRSAGAARPAQADQALGPAALPVRRSRLRVQRPHPSLRDPAHLAHLRRQGLPRRPRRTRALQPHRRGPATVWLALKPRHRPRACRPRAAYRALGLRAVQPHPARGARSRYPCPTAFTPTPAPSRFPPAKVPSMPRSSQHSPAASPITTVSPSTTCCGRSRSAIGTSASISPAT